MPLLSLEELSDELCVPCESIKELIDKKIITPYGGRARLGDPKFSSRTLPDIRDKLKSHLGLLCQ